MNKIFVSLVFFIIAVSASSGLDITRHSITWTISGTPTNGTYANGDPWVVGPVTITNITPKSTLVSGRTKNGSVINPNSAPFPSHGFDSALGGGTGFSTAKNVGRPNGADISAGNPLVVANGSSLISSVSIDAAGNRPQLSSISYLTVVASPPASGAFRPPYCGTDKTHYWNKSDLDYSILSNLVPVATSPSITTAENEMSRPWFELGTQTIGRYFHPSDRMPEYGRDIGETLGHLLLVLNQNYTNAEKETLYIRLVQWGIDIYGCAKTGGVWSANGGHNCGRKCGLVLAGLALDDSNILQYANKANYFIFGEDQQTWVVSSSDVGRVLIGLTGKTPPSRYYNESDVGNAEWGFKHSGQPQYDNPDWGAVYRDVVFQGELAEALSMEFISGAKAAWNWSPFFDYFDRAFDHYGGPPASTFARDMYNAYRFSAAGVATPIAIPGSGSFSAPINVTLSTTTGGANIYYTLNGTTPTSSSTLYTGAIAISDDTTLKAIGIDPTSTLSDSSVLTEQYLFAPLASSSTWVNSPEPIGSNTMISFVISAAGNNIDAVTGFSDQAAASYADLAMIVRFNASGNIDVRNGSAYSALASYPYTALEEYLVEINFDINASTYSVTVTSDPNGTPGTPTQIASNYSFRTEKIGVTSIDYISLYALTGSHTVDDLTYSSSVQPVISPTFDSVQPGNYSSAQSVTIQTNETGATTYYRTDGNTPTESDTEYTTAIPVTSTTTISARSFKSGFDPSPVLIGVFTISDDIMILPNDEFTNVALDNNLVGRGQIIEQVDVSNTALSVVAGASTGDIAVEGDAPCQWRISGGVFQANDGGTWSAENVVNVTVATWEVMRLLKPSKFDLWVRELPSGTWQQIANEYSYVSDRGAFNRTGYSSDNIGCTIRVSGSQKVFSVKLP